MRDGARLRQCGPRFFEPKKISFNSIIGPSKGVEECITENTEIILIKRKIIEDK